MTNRKLGKLPPRFDCRTLQFGDYAAPLPAPPPSISWLIGFDSYKKPWGMLGNDTIGDCTIAGYAHRGMAVRAAAGKLWLPTAASVKIAYFKLTGGQDTGLDLLTVLNAARKGTGLLGDKLGAYAQVRPLNALHVYQAIAYLEGLYIGLAMPDKWLSQPQGQVWDTGRGVKANPQNGHCVPVLAYDQVKSTLTVLTWGYEQKVTLRGFQAVCDEAYAIAAPDMLRPDATAPTGLSYDKINADLAAVTQ